MAHPFRLDVIGFPACGITTRVETQVKIRIRLSGSDGYRRPDHWTHILLPTELFSGDPGARVFREPARTLKLSARVLRSSSEPGAPLYCCERCVPRELRRLARRRTLDQPLPYDSPPMQLLLMSSRANQIPINNGEALVPVRITCYCSHHAENVGFRVHFDLTDNLGNFVASCDSPPILVADNHKIRRRSNEESNSTGDNFQQGSNCSDSTPSPSIANTSAHRVGDLGPVSALPVGAPLHPPFDSKLSNSFPHFLGRTGQESHFSPPPYSRSYSDGPTGSPARASGMCRSTSTAPNYSTEPFFPGSDRVDPQSHRNSNSIPSHMDFFTSYGPDGRQNSFDRPGYASSIPVFRNASTGDYPYSPATSAAYQPTSDAYRMQF